MMNIFIRRSSITSSICKRALVSLTSAESFHQSAAELVSVARNRAFGGEIRDYVSSSFFLGVLGVRGLHSGSRPLDYKASVVSQARRAAAVQEVTSDDEDDIITASSKDGLKISKLGIANEIVQALAKKGIKSLFPIQKAVLEPAMQGRDMIARAKTGTGKTLAFGIPIMDKIIQYNAKHGKGKHPLALVLAPTRELARQVEKEFYESAPNLDTLCVYGGTPIQPQMSELKRGMDIVVGTPGRVTDLIKRGALNLSKVQFAVLDEADQMLAVGFVEAVGTIMNKLPEHRQSLMFSATMPTWIKKLTQRHLKKPLVIDLVGDDDQKLAEGITLYSIASDSRAKASILGPLITQHGKGGKCIIFTATKRDADRLSSALSRRMKCQALHGDITQQQREKTLSGFREGYFNVLCATDVASRGLDIPHVDLVIHFEAPNSSEIFVHRSGRTGRAGKKGTVILVHTDQQRRIVQQIEQEVGNKFKELPKISVASGDMLDIGGSGGGSSRFGSFGSNGGGGSGGYRSSDRSSSRGYSGSGHSGSSSSGRGGFGSGRSGSSSFGHSRSDESDSDNFGSFGGRSSGRSSSKSSPRKSW